MKTIVNANLLTDQPERIARQAGYGYIRDRVTGQDSFVRRLSSEYYPRFHLYIERDGPERVVFNLHLDQKRSGVRGTSRHGGEYEGALVEEEMMRLKQFIVAAARQVEC